MGESKTVANNVSPLDCELLGLVWFGQLASYVVHLSVCLTLISFYKVRLPGKNDSVVAGKAPSTGRCLVGVVGFLDPSTSQH